MSETLSTLSNIITLTAIFLPLLNIAAMFLVARPEKDEESSAYIASITLSGTILNAGGWPGIAGVGGEFANDFLYIKSKGRWYDYCAPGGMIGLSGASLSVEVGAVYRIEEVKDYTGWYFTTSFGGSKHIFKPFAGLYSKVGITAGMSGALFWSPSGKRSYGYKAGGMACKGSAIWSWTAARYWAGPFWWNKPILDFLNTYVAPPQGDTAAEAIQFSENLQNDLESFLSI